MARVLASARTAAAVTPLFQPIVDTGTGHVRGYEALSRWPAVPRVDPAAVFTAARSRGRIVEVDAACRAAVMGAVSASGLDAGTTLFVNLEPDTLGAALDAGVDVFGPAARKYRIVLELTERALLDDPAELIAVVGRARARARGFGIALDDVGAAPESMALLSLIAPDVVKLDASLLGRDLTDDQVRVVVGVAAYAQAMGAVVLAEGVETGEHRERARALGATLAQGWSYGRPAPLPRRSRLASFPFRWGRRSPIALLPDAFHVPDRPSDAIPADRVRIAPKCDLTRLSRFLELQAIALLEPVTVLATFGQARWFTDAAAGRYATLAQRNPFVAVLGIGMSATPAPGVRGTDLSQCEPFADEWTLVIVGQHYFAALTAKDMGDSGPDADRRFQFALSFDRRTVVAVGRSVMRRIAAT